MKSSASRLSYEMLFYYYVLILLWLPNTSCLEEFPPPLPAMVYSTLPLLLSRGSFLLVRAPLPCSPNGLVRLPQGKLLWAEHQVFPSGSGPFTETTWIAPRRTEDRYSWAWRESRAPIGQTRGKHPAGWGGAGSGSGRRQLRRYGRFRTGSRSPQVPWAGLRHAETGR